MCLSVCLWPHKSVIFQPIFKCDTWLDASLPGAGSYYDHMIYYTGCFEKTPLKSILYCFFVRLCTTTKFHTTIAFNNLNHVSKFEGNWLKTHILVVIFVKVSLFVKSQSER